MYMGKFPECRIMFLYYTTITFDVSKNRYVEVYPSKKSEIQMQYGRTKGGDAPVNAVRTQKGMFVLIIAA